MTGQPDIETQVRSIVTEWLELENGEQMIAAKPHAIAGMVRQLADLADPTSPAAIIRRYVATKTAQGYHIIRREHARLGDVYILLVGEASGPEARQLIYTAPQNGKPYAMRLDAGLAMNLPLDTLLDNELDGTRLV